MKITKIMSSVAMSAVLLGSLSGVAFADDAGTTDLTAEACVTLESVEAYSIDYGSFTAADVQSASQTNAGTKGDGGNGVERTPTSAGDADYYVYIDDICANGDWSVTVTVDDMAETTSLGATDIPAANQRLAAATDGTVYRFNNSAANGNVSAPVVADNTSLDAPQTVLIHDNTTPNGIAGQYGALLTHDLEIPQNQVPTTYQGAFTVACVNCS